MNQAPARLVVVPSDPIAAYEQAGYDWLERYFNPTGMFQEVVALSPLEEGDRQAFGMTIRRADAKEFREALREIRPAVVRAYGGYWPSDFVCENRIDGIPVVVSVHDTANIYSSVRYADLVICVSEAVASRVRALGTAPGKIHILPNRVDTKIFKPMQGRKAPVAIGNRLPPGKHILHVGRKHRQKNLDTLIRALALLPEDYSCVFVGMGDRAEYATLAKNFGIEQRCVWIDSVKNSELPLWYSWCDCMCTPSRWEGFGIVFIEAAACGAPIVTSDIAPMNEYLKHDESAYLIKEYENPRSLAEGIRRVCEDAAYRAKIGEGGLTVARRFDSTDVDAMEAEIYREAMKVKPSALRRKIEAGHFKAGRAARWVARKTVMRFSKDLQG